MTIIFWIFYNMPIKDLNINKNETIDSKNTVKQK